MRLLLIHNRYQNPGGEDECLASEASLLRLNGHHVFVYAEDNARISKMNPLSLGAATLWNSKIYKRLREMIRDTQADVTHFHNVFPLVSPAAYYAAKRERVAVVQTLHNYRLICPNSLLFRDRHLCESCVGRAIPWPAVWHSCYRNSRLMTAGVATMLSFHRALGTWQRSVDAYIAQTEFARSKFVEGGLPKDRIYVKPNFVHPDPGFGSGEGSFALFVGRLSAEKGLQTLLDAWRLLPAAPELKLVGEGSATGNALPAGVTALGRLPRAEVFALMRSASFLVFPSECHESAPLTILEALAAGLPVVASDRGGARSLICGNQTGLFFRAGDARDLADRVSTLWSDRRTLEGMKLRARAEFERKYTAGQNYALLMDIYQRTLSLVNRGASVSQYPKGSPASETQ